jgi:hypothetical protein
MTIEEFGCDAPGCESGRVDFDGLRVASDADGGCRGQTSFDRVSRVGEWIGIIAGKRGSHRHPADIQLARGPLPDLWSSENNVVGVGARLQVLGAARTCAWVVELFFRV